MRPGDRVPAPIKALGVSRGIGSKESRRSRSGLVWGRGIAVAIPIKAPGVSRGIGCHTWRRVKRHADTIAYAQGLYQGLV
jgi:hypothetical protein